MKDQDNPNLREILDRAADLPPERRSAFLDTACNGNAELRAEIESLLSHLEREYDLLRGATMPPGAFKTRVVASGAVAPSGERPGSCIGRYKLLQLIGEGGFGSVFMAEQETPVVRKVALKIIKLGMDSKQIIARFEAERQALAMMDHPNIAKVLDAGTTDTGRPYFVMELVRGVPITAFCNDNKLTTRQRLELFVLVCSALQHAHQKGIIHRDLKPGNVLVTMHDDKPVPKIIDFGVAKALNQRLTEHTLFTEFRQLIGTPAYMSPEQAQMSGLDVDTRSDIYSLGVLLYELLTGTTPFDPKQLHGAAYGEMQRIIREVEPPKPSTRLSTLAAGTKSTLADQRRCDPATLSRVLAGDLDWIIMKCLEKDRSRRYETANGLARDIQRYLNDEPVEASPPSASYRLRKLARRHRREAITLAAIMAVLVLGIIGTTIGFVQARANLATARAAQHQAQQSARDMELQRNVAAANEAKAREAERREASQHKQAEAVAGILESIFQRLDPYSEKSGGLDLKAELITEMDKIAAAPEKDASGDPLVQARLLDSLGWTQLQLGEIDKAERLLEAALTERQWMGPADDAQKYRIQFHLGVAYDRAGRSVDAIKLLEQVRAWQASNIGADSRDTLSTLYRLASVYDSAGRYTDALHLYQQVRDRQTLSLGSDDPDTLRTLEGLADTYGNVDRTADRIKLLQEVRERQTKRIGADHPDTLHTERSLGWAYLDAGGAAEAVALITQVRDRQIRQLPPEHPDVLLTIETLAEAYRRVGQTAEAIRLAEQLQQTFTRKLGPDHPSTDMATSHLANMYQYAGRIPDQVQMLEGLCSQRIQRLGPDDPATLRLQHILAMAYDAAGRRSESIRLLETARDKLISRFGPDHSDVLRTLAELGRIYHNAGRNLDAARLLEQVRDHYARTLGAEHPNTLGVTHYLATAYIREGRSRECISLLEQVRDICQRAGHIAFWREMAYTLGEAYVDVGRTADAIRLLEAIHGERNELHTMRILADAYSQAGRTSDAIEVTERIRQQSVKGYGPYGRQTIGDTNRLISLYRKAGRTSDALQLGESLRQGATDNLGPDDPATILATDDLINLYKEVHRGADATKLAKDVLPHKVLAKSKELEINPSDPTLLTERSGLYAQMGKPEKSAADFRKAIEIISERILQKSGTPEVTLSIEDRALLYSRRGKFREAADDFAKAIEIAPTHHDYWHEGVVPALLAAGDVEGYRRWRTRELRQFAQTADAATAHRIAKDACMAELHGQELTMAGELADRAMDFPGWEWASQQSKGMLEYRRGHYAEAIKSLTKSKDLTPIRAATPYWIAADELFIAMACERSGKREDAQAAFQTAARIMADFPRAGEADLDAGWGPVSDWIVCEVIRREAEALINANPDTTQPAASTQTVGAN